MADTAQRASLVTKLLYALTLIAAALPMFGGLPELVRLLMEWPQNKNIVNPIHALTSMLVIGAMAVIVLLRLAALARGTVSLQYPSPSSASRWLRVAGIFLMTMGLINQGAEASLSFAPVAAVPLMLLTGAFHSRALLGLVLFELSRLIEYERAGSKEP